MLLLFELSETDRLSAPREADSVSDTAPGGARSGLFTEFCFTETVEVLRFDLRRLTVLRMSEPSELKRDREERVEMELRGVTAC